MKNSHWGNLKSRIMLFVAAGAMYSCSLDTVTDDLQEADLQTEQTQQNINMRMAPTVSCAEVCIEEGSEIYYPVSDMATGTSGKNTKSVSYTAYNTETDFVVEVTYTITSGPANAKATISIDIDGDEVEFADVNSGSTVSHTVALGNEWAGCDQIAFSVVQEGLGTPISFSESYSLIPVCPEVSLEIGDAYQGGIIAYILQAGDPGYDANETHGIIAAPSDQSTNAFATKVPGSLTLTGASGTDLGTGQANTTDIVNAQGIGIYAAQICNDLELNGYSDWYLPSKDELNKLYENRLEIGNFASSGYWSSSMGDFYLMWYQDFNNGNQDIAGQTVQFRVRAVRSF
ncbi:Lcl C-terminal domain-containing protein [Algoriphagus boritolerans]|nr:DUF1566 domain-containing protein [Algoriphagus boritolerans]